MQNIIVKVALSSMPSLNTRQNFFPGENFYVYSVISVCTGLSEGDLLKSGDQQLWSKYARILYNISRSKEYWIHVYKWIVVSFNTVVGGSPAVYRPCPIMLQNLPISQVYKSHIFHLYISLKTHTHKSQWKMSTSRRLKLIMTYYCTAT